jgi:hypothetical protein
MNLKKHFTMAAVVMTATTATLTASGYNYPSGGIPGGHSPDQVDQYVTFIWDDNGYSGMNGTSYETKQGTNLYADMGFVGGYVRDWASEGWKVKPGGNNPLNIEEGDMGIAWALHTLAGFDVPQTLENWSASATYQSGAIVAYEGKLWKATGWMAQGTTPGSAGESWATWEEAGTIPEPSYSRSNPDGSPITMTFNMISGLFVPAVGSGWQDRESKYGYYTDQDANPYIAEQSGHKRIAISWGREAMYGTTAIPDRDGTDFMVQMVKRLESSSQEIGNHTIDHLETNSPLPLSYWPNNGEGFDDGSSGTDALGNPWSEVEEFGGHPQGYQQTCGWMYNVGRSLSVTAWEDIISLGEVDGPEQGINSELKAFRAPRLEVNSEMFFALANQGYRYDCGLEEGYEVNRDGTNFIWPYTTDNGNPNVWTQKSYGETIYIDSMPQGLWQYPVNVMIVPENLRPGIIAKANQISIGAGDEQHDDSWLEDGKITGFDFNMFILWGMSGDEVEATLKHTLDLRMNGNKAPMQIGCHTDYFTPVYDNATLMNETNKNSYGLVVSQGWNTWADRKTSFENFVDYALQQGAYIKSGIETIEYVDSLYSAGVNTNGLRQDVVTGPWTFGGEQTIGYDENVLDRAQVEFGSNVDEQYGYYLNMLESNIGNVKYIEIPNYSISQAVYVSVLFEDGKEVQALLNNLNTNANSGIIPIEQLEAFTYADYTTADVDITQDVIGISINPQSTGNTTETITIPEVIIYSDNAVSIEPMISNNNGITSFIMNERLTITTHRTGTYDVTVSNLRGQVINSQRVVMKAGTNQLDINMAKGLYILNITDGNTINVTSKIMF